MLLFYLSLLGVFNDFEGLVRFYEITVRNYDILSGFMNIIYTLNLNFTKVSGFMKSPLLDNATNVPNTPSDFEEANTEVEMVHEYINKVADKTVGGDKVHDNNSNTLLA